MSFEYRFDCGSSPSMFFDTNSRDSGFYDSPVESLGDDAFLEEFSKICYESSDLPTDFSDLIRKPLRRTFSIDDSPLKKKVCQRVSPDFCIRKKTMVRKSKTEEVAPRINHQARLFRSEEEIKLAIQRSCSEPDLIGDFSKSYSLPLTESRHQDLKAISGDTLKQLMEGQFKDSVDSFKIVDCRYPYEYNGGHIEGAINVYTHDQCSALLESDRPSVLIFHCEFSAERGPNLYRHLRQEDRRINAQMYPSLYFPEIYILEGGYRKFFDEHPEMCYPVGYTQMLDPRFSEQLLFFRQISKTWDSDVKSTCRKQSMCRRRFIL